MAGTPTIPLEEMKYGYVIPNVDLKAEIQHHVMLLILCKAAYHCHSFLNLSDHGCMREFTFSSV